MHYNGVEWEKSDKMIRPRMEHSSIFFKRTIYHVGAAKE